MRIVITRRDIEHGHRGSANRCPVVRALERRLRQRIIVSAEGIVYERGFRSTLPPAVRERISAYDRGQPMRPFWFSLPTYAYRYGLA